MTLEQMLFGQGGARPARQFEGFLRARVRTSGASGVFVTLDDVGDSQFFGPCRWSRPVSSTAVAGHTHGGDTTGSGDHSHAVLSEAYPPPGTRCLVAFSDYGAADPWIVAFDRWPS